MAKHEFHTLDNCSAQIAWLRYEDSEPCYLRYVYTIPGTVEASYANERTMSYRKHGMEAW